MRTGQLITSFLQGKANPTMTSTIFNPYVDPATVASRTGYLKESHGEIPGTSKGGGKTVGVRLLRVLNDLLPYKLRPIKTKRRRLPVWYGVRHEWFAFRMVWRSHKGPALRAWIKQVKPWK